MAHLYRIRHLRGGGAGPPGGLRYLGEASTSADGRRQRLGSQRPDQLAHCPAAQGDWRSPTDRRRRAPRPSAPRPSMSWTPCRGRRRRSPGRRATSSSSWRPSPTTAHGGTSTRRRPACDITTRDPVGQHLPRHQRLQRHPGQPARAGGRRRRRHDHDRTVARRQRPAPSSSARNAADPLPPPPAASPVAAPPAPARWRSAGAAGPGSVAGKPISTRAVEPAGAAPHARPVRSAPAAPRHAPCLAHRRRAPARCPSGAAPSTAGTAGGCSVRSTGSPAVRRPAHRTR